MKHEADSVMIQVFHLKLERVVRIILKEEFPGLTHILTTGLSGFQLQKVSSLQGISNRFTHMALKATELYQL